MKSTENTGKTLSEVGEYIVSSNTGYALERALLAINRDDVVKKCVVETDEVEAAAARVAMDQSGG